MSPEAVWMPNMGSLHPVTSYHRPSITRTEACFGYKSDIVVVKQNASVSCLQPCFHDPVQNNIEPCCEQAAEASINSARAAGSRRQPTGDATEDMDRAVLIEHRMHVLQHNIDPSAEAATLPTQSPGRSDGQGEAAPSCDLTPGVDIYGHDLRGLYAERAEDCCGLCAHEPGCLAWTCARPFPQPLCLSPLCRRQSPERGACCCAQSRSRRIGRVPAG